MRHNVFGKHLNRDIKERTALFKNLIRALIEHGRVKTTIVKAKAISRIIEKLVNHSKRGTSSAIVQVSSFLTHKDSIHRLTQDIAPKFKDKTGGYVRIHRVANRVGDNAEQAIIEWTTEKEEKPKEK